MVDSSTGIVHTRVESKEASGAVLGYYDVQDKECKRLHYKADTLAGFRTLKVENKTCETGGRQGRLHDGSAQKSTPFKVRQHFNPNSGYPTSPGEFLFNFLV